MIDYLFIFLVALALVVGWVGKTITLKHHTSDPVAQVVVSQPSKVPFQNKVWDRCNVSIIADVSENRQLEMVTCTRDVPVTCSAK